jgi:hypothetical protein
MESGCFPDFLTAEIAKATKKNTNMKMVQKQYSPRGWRIEGRGWMATRRSIFYLPSSIFVCLCALCGFNSACLAQNPAGPYETMPGITTGNPNAPSYGGTFTGNGAGLTNLMGLSLMNLPIGAPAPILALSYFPEDAGLLGELITMHHIGGTPITVPLPATRHLNGHMPGGFRYNSGGPGSAFPVYPGAIP